VASAERAPVLWLPLTGSAPDHAPVAAHAVALTEDQISVELPPLATMLGLAVIVTVGAAAAVSTVTVAVWLAPPPPPQPDSTHADITQDDANISGKYQLRLRACMHPRAVHPDSSSMQNISI